MEKNFQSTAEVCNGIPVFSAEKAKPLVHSTALWVPQLISNQAARTPAALAVKDDKQSLTFIDLESRANRLARHIQTLGVGSETPVGLYFERSTDFVVAALAVLKCGGAYVPLDPAYPPSRIEAILKHVETPVLLSHRWMAASLPGGSWRTVDLDCEFAAINCNDPSAFHVEITGPQLAYVVYTSGSTGKPKGVEVTHANLLHLMHWHQRAFAVTASDRASQIAGLAFDAAVWEIWPHLAAGASLHLIDEASRRSPEGLRDWLIKNEVTIAFVPTILAEQLITLPWPAGTPLRILLTGADTLHRFPPPALPFTLINNYGPTECTVLVTSGPVESTEQTGSRLPSIGHPIDHTEILILDENLNRVLAGGEGEICVAGPQVARGYRALPDLTAESFVRDRESGCRIYRTGDRGRILPDGSIAFLGRIDDQIKIRGFRIEPDEIAAHLDSHPKVRSSVITTRGDSAGEKALTAYIVAAAKSEITAGELRQHLASRVPDYMVPSLFVSMSSLPITTAGKCDKRALPAPSVHNLLPDMLSVEASPQDGHAGVGTLVSQLVSGLMNGRTIGPDDNFFLAGGHSMMAAQLIARLRETLNVTLNLRELFEAPTISSLSAVVNGKLSN